ncbi:MAG: glycosyltransferase, partial [Pseudomonadota bacterium]
TEAFPFGRRQMLFELLPLLNEARNAEWKPMIAASIRDIMQEGRKEKRVIESVNLVRDFYDLVLVHGDENLIRIEETLQGAENFLHKVRYTGLVTPEASSKQQDPGFECDVLISVGGGAFGQELTRMALKAMEFSKRFPSNWLVTAGTELADDDFLHLQQHCPDGMRIVRRIPDLASAMKSAKVSVSHAGYNTVADILRSGCRSVLYPYVGDKETEQLRRSQLMAEKGVAVILEPGRLLPENLASAIDEAACMEPERVDLKLEGASQTAILLQESYREVRL